MKVAEEFYNRLLHDDFDEEEGFTMIEEGDWVSDYKWENKRVIVQHIETESYYAVYGSRSGSYYSDYHYDEPDTDSNGMVTLDLVVPREKVIVEYV